MIERFFARLGGRQKYLHLLAHGVLSGVIGKPGGPDGPIDKFFLVGATGRDQAIGFNHL